MCFTLLMMKWFAKGHKNPFVPSLFLSVFQLEPGKGYTYHAPTQAPIDPPYKQACILRKSDKLAKQGPRLTDTSNTSCVETSAQESVESSCVGSSVPSCETSCEEHCTKSEEDTLVGARGGIEKLKLET